jgi:hypothetical protein
MKLPPLTTPEQNIHEAVATLLHRVVLPPAEWTFFPAGAVPLPPRLAAKLYRMGLRRGWPDFIIVHDRIYGLELKREGGTLSKTRTVRNKRGGVRLLDGQVEVFPRLERAGMVLAVCRTVDEVLQQLVRWQIPVRWHMPLEVV